MGLFYFCANLYQNPMDWGLEELCGKGQSQMKSIAAMEILQEQGRQALFLFLSGHVVHHRFQRKQTYFLYRHDAYFYC